MNGPIDDKAFEEYLQRGSSVSQHYRSLDDEAVPPELDAAVLARAAQALAEPRATRGPAWRRWSVPVTLAAATVLAVSIVLESGTRHEVNSSLEVAAPAAVEAPVPTVESVDLRATAQAREEVPTASAPVASEPPASAAPSLAAERAAAERRLQAEAAQRRALEAKAVERQRATAQAARAQRPAGDGVAPPPPAPAMAPLVRQAVPVAPAASDATAGEVAARFEPPGDWLERIRALREAGKAEEADREWRAFREAYPDYEVAEDDAALPANTR